MEVINLIKTVNNVDKRIHRIFLYHLHQQRITVHPGKQFTVPRSEHVYVFNTSTIDIIPEKVYGQAIIDAPWTGSSGYKTNTLTSSSLM